MSELDHILKQRAVIQLYLSLSLLVVGFLLSTWALPLLVSMLQLTQEEEPFLAVMAMQTEVVLPKGVPPAARGQAVGNPVESMLMLPPWMLLLILSLPKMLPNPKRMMIRMVMQQMVSQTYFGTHSPPTERYCRFCWQEGVKPGPKSATVATRQYHRGRTAVVEVAAVVVVAVAAD